MQSPVQAPWALENRTACAALARAMQDGEVYHTYSAYARGVDGIWGMYQWLDRAPLGRNEQGVWWRHHDRYEGSGNGNRPGHDCCH